jgi:GNAT superfamily N-acetyltransferase
MIEIRHATGADARSIRDIFEANYGHDYIYPEYYEAELLKKLVYGDDTLVLVAEETQSKDILGTASVVLESGAYSDLAGEFGRLAVHPDAWGRGIGSMLLQRRIEEVEHRLHVGFMEARVFKPHSLANGLHHDFLPVGFLPLRLRLGSRWEHAALLVRYFGDALELRRNHPRVVAEVYQLANLSLEQVGIRPDVVVDEEASSYPPAGLYSLQQMTEHGYSSLLRIERGRLRRREIFGPLRLHYGFFKLRSERSHYLIAKSRDQVVGAIGYTHDEVDQNIRIFELISLDDYVVRFLLEQMERVCRERSDVCCIEIDVRADAPRMQRTLVEMSYVPVAYVPAFAFHKVERLDVVKMQRLLVSLPELPCQLLPPADRVAELVLEAFAQRQVLPGIDRTLSRSSFLRGLSDEQMRRLGGVCSRVSFDSGEKVFRAGEPCSETYLLLDGEVEVRGSGSRPLGRVGPGECLGEVALMIGTPHSADAIAVEPVKAAVLTHEALSDLVHQRPDIGIVLYRNLARGLSRKLRRTDLDLAAEVARQESRHARPR